MILTALGHVDASVQQTLLKAKVTSLPERKQWFEVNLKAIGARWYITQQKLHMASSCHYIHHETEQVGRYFS